MAQQPGRGICYCICLRLQIWLDLDCRSIVDGDHKESQHSNWANGMKNKLLLYVARESSEHLATVFRSRVGFNPLYSWTNNLFEPRRKWKKKQTNKQTKSTSKLFVVYIIFYCCSMDKRKKKEKLKMDFWRLQRYLFSVGRLAGCAKKVKISICWSFFCWNCLSQTESISKAAGNTKVDSFSYSCRLFVIPSFDVDWRSDSFFISSVSFVMILF